ncbi:MAG: hypothetical protein IKV03_02830 [Alphaproteobacteria bacterium]|nr:hypothetical protein [Alphaproteobacteria bacterium]
MLKAFLIVAGIVLIGFLIMDEAYNFSFEAFDYEFTSSIALLIVGIVVLCYLLHLIKKPFGWIKNYRSYRFQKNLLKKENFLTLVLTTVLDKNNTAEKMIMNKEKSLFSKGSTEQLLFEALFHPSEHVFEKLKNNKATELAGIRGLFLQAKEKGDIDTQTQLLEKVSSLYPTVLWINQEQLNLQLLQNDWQNALITLEKLSKNKAIEKTEYTKIKACILYGLKRYKDAFELTPDNPPLAWAYAEQNPNKAEDILKKSWTLTPTWETFERYYALIKNETTVKQMKSIEHFVSSNSATKLSLLATTDVAMKNHLWGVAKETLQNAINSYELTRQMASMMAELEREGWHHEEAAKEWENKAANLEETPSWVCTYCHHNTGLWDNVCPICNTCGGIVYKG